MHDSKQNKRNYLLDLYANYSHVFNEKHHFSAMAGYGWQHFWKNSDATTLFRKAKNCSRQSTMSLDHLLSFYGRLNYSYDNRYDCANYSLCVQMLMLLHVLPRINCWGLFLPLHWMEDQSGGILRDSKYCQT